MEKYVYFFKFLPTDNTVSVSNWGHWVTVALNPETVESVVSRSLLIIVWWPEKRPGCWGWQTSSPTRGSTTRTSSSSLNTAKSARYAIRSFHVRFSFFVIIVTNFYYFNFANLYAQSSCLGRDSSGFSSCSYAQGCGTRKFEHSSGSCIFSDYGSGSRSDGTKRERNFQTANQIGEKPSGCNPRKRQSYCKQVRELAFSGKNQKRNYYYISEIIKKILSNIFSCLLNFFLYPEPGGSGDPKWIRFLPVPSPQPWLC